MQTESDSDNQTRGSSANVGLKLNTKKCQVIKVNSKSDDNLKVGESEVEEVESFTISWRECDKGRRWNSRCQEGNNPDRRTVQATFQHLASQGHEQGCKSLPPFTVWSGCEARKLGWWKNCLLLDKIPEENIQDQVAATHPKQSSARVPFVPEFFACCFPSFLHRPSLP